MELKNGTDSPIAALASTSEDQEWKFALMLGAFVIGAIAIVIFCHRKCAKKEKETQKVDELKYIEELKEKTEETTLISEKDQQPKNSN